MSKIEFLDHVAIRVSDPEASAEWYCRVLGLKRWQPDEWKPVPIMVMAASSGIALFSDKGHVVPDELKKVFHIAFRGESIESVKAVLSEEGLDYVEEDHTYFHSIYFQDPDGYRLEVTVPSSA